MIQPFSKSSPAKVETTTPTEAAAIGCVRGPVSALTNGGWAGMWAKMPGARRYAYPGCCPGVWQWPDNHRGVRL